MEWKLDFIEGSTDELKSSIEKLVNEFEKTDLENLSIDEFKELVSKKEKINLLMSKLHAFYGLKQSENTKDPQVLAKLTELDQWGAELDMKMHNFRDWFVNLDDASKFIQAMPDYTYYLESIRQLKPYMRNKEVEKVLTIKNITGSSSYSQLYTLFVSGFSYDFNGESGVTQEKVVSNFQSSDPKLREEAYNTVLTNYGKNAAIFSELYKNIVLARDNEGLKIRNYKSPISMRNFSNDIDDSVIDMLLSLIRKNAGIFVDYFKIKHDMIGKDFAFSRYHLYAPYPSEEKVYGYEESKEKVLEVYKKFSEEFYEGAKKIFDEEHVHVYPKENKRGGAFCYSPTTDITPYILLNHTNKRRDLFTMMHEFGHGIHGVLAQRQKELNYHTALPMAETASIFGEMLLGKDLLNEANDKEKLSILVHLLDGQWASIIRQAYFVIFEKQAHEMIAKGATEQELNKAYVKLLKEQFGDMKIPEEFEHEWKYIPHIYHTPFYCYAYSWGELLSLSLYKMYEKEGDSFKDKFTKLLASGGIAKPLDLLKEAGIDAASEEFWQGGFDLIKEEIEEMKQLHSRSDN